jgi:carboxypeptidase family protein
MKIGLQKAFLTITTWAFVCQLSAQAQAPTPGTVKGVVTDPAGAVLEGALIRIVSWGPDDRRKIVESEMAVHTDANGQYRFEVAPGVYDVFVSDSAFSPVTKQVNVEAGKEMVFNPKLKFSRFIKLLP